MRIGVLALQGDFAEHAAVLRRLGADAVPVRLPQQLEGLHGLIIPGGESTTIGKLAVEYGLLQALRADAELPIFGTCAGMVFLAQSVGHDQPLLGRMEMTVERNAFGRQVESFETEVAMDGTQGGPLHAVFIRAPVIRKTGPAVKVLARLPDGRAVAARQGRFLATAFHPELGGDDRVHRYFLKMVEEEGRGPVGLDAAA